MWDCFSFVCIAVPTPAQQKDELSCYGTAAIQYPVLQAVLPVLCLQCAWWAWQWGWDLLIAFLHFFVCMLFEHSLSMSFTCTGKGCVFTYDAVGSYERTGYGAQGTGSSLIMPVLDNQLKSPSPLLLPARVSLALYIFLMFLSDVIDCFCSNLSDQICTHTSKQWLENLNNRSREPKDLLNVCRMLSHLCRSQKPSILLRMCLHLQLRETSTL